MPHFGPYRGPWLPKWGAPTVEWSRVLAEKDPDRVFVDMEMTLEQRISRLEDLEVLRLGMHQTAEELDRAVEHGLGGTAALQRQLREAQEKAAGLISGIVKTARQRLAARDLHRSLPRESQQDNNFISDEAKARAASLVDGLGMGWGAGGAPVTTETRPRPPTEACTCGMSTSVAQAHKPACPDYSDEDSAWVAKLWASSPKEN